MLKWGEFKDVIGNLISDGGQDAEQDIERFAKMACRDVYRARFWRERRTRAWLATTAPVAGTAGTVAVDGTNLADTTDTLIAGYVGRKLAAAYGSPYVEISAFVDADNLTINPSWQDTAITAGAYIIYDDRVSLPSDCAAIESLYAYDGKDKYLLRHRPASSLAVNHHRDSTGEPLWYERDTLDSSDNMRIQVGPYAPDKVYNLELLYWKDYTAPTKDAAAVGIPDRLMDVAIQRTLYWAYQRDHFQRSQAALGAYYRLLHDAWAEEDDIHPEITQMGIPGVSRGADIVANFRSLEC